MENFTDKLVVLVTAANAEEGAKLAKLLVQERLAACVNVLSGVRSFFWWQGKIDEQEEVLLFIKTTRPLLQELIATVQAHHSYQVPEIIALPISAGADNYLRWLAAEVRTQPAD
ncbi:MAG: divalent-cation tolerance protein CutA [candidate division KSB1 bacterium]|nr:divalent-cation tolerance protein CutA [candidate division KSB1 bacterium]MDZ7272659.1 divalent-cation tolerance protein CutA [candidate division KSB1 bacterium]MDZ7284319.1 divalent-cation tolerance protein CutA [candidate division KSB1 bacterium]MDZ7297285.1 divalent-cation tolerance protein CutA [candidate division KSB1 bacterium]MDZ7309508.1 divalent-cation tolerance protein CutA [candidate division KSB1 bacterium]